jgi:hypothetical protein
VEIKITIPDDTRRLVLYTVNYKSEIDVQEFNGNNIKLLAVNKPLDEFETMFDEENERRKEK